MTSLLIVLLILSALMLCSPRAADSRAEIRAAARVAGWMAIAPAVRHLAVQALLLLVEVLRMAVNVVVFVAQVMAIAAGHLEATGTPRRAT